MRPIEIHLWFDKEAKEAAAFYVDALGNGSKVTSSGSLSDTPSGDVDTVSFELLGRKFQAISAGPYFKPNPSVSFHVKCKTKEEATALWGKLSAGGAVLMEFGEYPWSPLYGWCADKYGFSWQVFLDESDAPRQLVPVVMFVGGAAGRAQEAMDFWTSLFPDSKVGLVRRHGADAAPDKEGAVLYGSFTLMGQEFGAMDSAHEHKFAFNEAISLIVLCESQAEIDELWAKLSAVPEAEQCGWLKDKFGLSWQVTPVRLGELLGQGDAGQKERVTKAFLQMKKFHIEGLEKAFKG